MPNYHYVCKNESCQDEFEAHQSIKADALMDCPFCEQPSLERVIHSANAFIKGEPKTIGLLAERNTNRMSNSQRTEQFAIAEQRKYDAKVALRQELIDSGMKNVPVVPDKIKPIDKRLTKLTDRQKQTYVDKGKASMNIVHEENPHSIAIWIVLEKHERKSDGNLSGIPVEKKVCTGVFHLQNGIDASDKLESFTQKLKELIKREEQENDATSFDCSNCGAPLADVYVNPTNDKINWSMYANCPHCGDKSYIQEFEGLFSLVNDEKTQEYTIVENFDMEESPIVLQTVKVQDYVS